MKMGRFENSEGLTLFYRLWKNAGSVNKNDEMNKKDNGNNPVSKNDCLVIFFHGMGGHTEYWQLLADRIIDEADLIGYDYRGHGYSQGIRGDIDDFEKYLDDSIEFVDFILNRNKETMGYRSIFFWGSQWEP